MEFSSVVNAYLLPIRNRIAHSLVGPGELASSIDNALDMQTVFHWLPLLTQPSQFIEFSDEIGADGGGKPFALNKTFW